MSNLSEQFEVLITKDTWPGELGYMFTADAASNLERSIAVCEAWLEAFSKADGFGALACGGRGSHKKHQAVINKWQTIKLYKKHLEKALKTVDNIRCMMIECNKEFM